MTICKFEEPPTIKQLSLRRRYCGVTARWRTKLRELRAIILKAGLINLILRKHDAEKKYQDFMFVTMLYYLVQYQTLMTPNPELFLKLPEIRSRHRTIESFTDSEIVSYFRFRDRQQLRTLCSGFQFPDIMRCCHSRHKFSGEEVLLVGLYRMSHCSRYDDGGFREIFGFDYQKVGKCFNIFLNHMSENWDYLIRDHMEFWKPYIPQCSEAIRLKCDTLGCPFSSNNFKIFGFIDNTMNATCRPGAGPAFDGSGAPRKDKDIETSFYNGWKKIHGLKWQTADLPCGMIFHAFGPATVRRNDLWMLGESSLDGKLRQLVADMDKSYLLYGDSAYAVSGLTNIVARKDTNVGDNNVRARFIKENSVLSSCREAIEWDYNDMKRYWPIVDYKKILKMKKMPVSKIFLVAMLLHNSYVCMNGSITSYYFEMEPPPFEDWVSLGKKKENLGI